MLGLFFFYFLNNETFLIFWELFLMSFTFAETYEDFQKKKKNLILNLIEKTYFRVSGSLIPSLICWCDSKRV